MSLEEGTGRDQLGWATPPWAGPGHQSCGFPALSRSQVGCGMLYLNWVLKDKICRGSEMGKGRLGSGDTGYESTACKSIFEEQAGYCGNESIPVRSMCGGRQYSKQRMAKLLHESWVERLGSWVQAHPKQGILPKPHRAGGLL